MRAIYACVSTIATRNECERNDDRMRTRADELVKQQNDQRTYRLPTQGKQRGRHVSNHGDFALCSEVAKSAFAVSQSTRQTKVCVGVEGCLTAIGGSTNVCPAGIDAAKAGASFSRLDEVPPTCITPERRRCSELRVGRWQ